MIKQVKVGPYIYNIKLEKSPKDKDNNTLFGEINSKTRIILLDSENDNVQMTVTLLHELSHLISAEYGLALDERDVTVLAMALASLFADNPELGVMIKELSE